MDLLEVLNISVEKTGCLVPGKLQFTNEFIIYKNARSGSTERIIAKDLETAQFQCQSSDLCLRLFGKNGSLHRYTGIKEQEKEKIKQFFKAVYNKDIIDRELGLEGWNWGETKFEGSTLQFNVNKRSTFEIPLENVSQCVTSKNEVTVEFHHNDEAPVALMEMRFYIPNAHENEVKSFRKNVLSKAKIVNVSGDVIATFSEIQCVTPRGRYEIKIYQSFLQLHGKTFDYKIPIGSVVRLLLLPHKDKRHIYFIVNLNPPIRQGLTRYHFLVFTFNLEDTTSIELSLTESELKSMYGDKLQKNMSGPLFEVLANVTKTVVNKKITCPNFIGMSETSALSCTYKAAAGHLYPLENGIIFIYKPPLYARFEEVSSVNFARGDSNTRSFDIEIELKSGLVHVFSNIDKAEYDGLCEYIKNKKVLVKNKAKKGFTSIDGKNHFINSEDEKDYMHDLEMEEGSDSKESASESTDDDFNPEQAKNSDADDEEEETSESDKSDMSLSELYESPSIRSVEKRKPVKRIRQTKSKEVDVNKPKRPLSAFMLWLNDNRSKIKSKEPNMTVTEVAKMGGKLWAQLHNKSKWEEKAIELKLVYDETMKMYKDKLNSQLTIN